MWAVVVNCAVQGFYRNATIACRIADELAAELAVDALIEVIDNDQDVYYVPRRPNAD